MQNAGALGSGANPERQTLNVTGPNGTFELSFNGSTTGPINIGSPTLLTDLTNALNALPSISGPSQLGGARDRCSGLASNSNVFTITFGGNLAFSNVPH